jgi:hypothetical protein
MVLEAIFGWAPSGEGHNASSTHGGKQDKQMHLEEREQLLSR